MCVCVCVDLVTWGDISTLLTFVANLSKVRGQGQKYGLKNKFSTISLLIMEPARQSEA